MMGRILGAAAALALGLGGISAQAFENKVEDPPEGNPLPELVSGYHFRSPDTQELQDDDFLNPGFLWVDTGAQLWETVEGSAGESCASCHGDAEESMKGVGASYPAYSEELGKPINLEQRINKCRVDNMGAEPWDWESEELLAMTVYVRRQSKGMPVDVDISGPARPFFEKGKEFYYQRRGQLDMACSNCHEDYYGRRIRADMLSQGHINGFPTYRLKWQKVGSAHRRFRGCNKRIRAIPYGYGSQEYVNLELYLAWRGQGLKVETPAVRQ